MAITRQTIEGQLTWGTFETGLKTDSKVFEFSWNEKETIVKKVDLQGEFWWNQTGLCPGNYANVYLNNNFVGKAEWFIDCGYRTFTNTVIINNGKNTVRVDGNNAIPGISTLILFYRITLIIEYIGKEPTFKPLPPPGVIDLSQILPLLMLGFIPVILIPLFRKIKERKKEKKEEGEK
jgi:hypothetical protein